MNVRDLYPDKEAYENSKTPQLIKPMKWRVILRCSLNCDSSSRIRNEVLARLKEAGFTNTNSTGTWETDGCTIEKAASALSYAIEKLAKVSSRAEFVGHPYLDHLWIYIDCVESAPPSIGLA